MKMGQVGSVTILMTGGPTPVGSAQGLRGACIRKMRVRPALPSGCRVPWRFWRVAAVTVTSSVISSA